MPSPMKEVDDKEDDIEEEEEEQQQQQEEEFIQLPLKQQQQQQEQQQQQQQYDHQLPWVEKYRPKLLDDVLGNEETVNRLKAIAKMGNVPNLILSGPPGTGKTTSIHALARELLGSAYKNAVLELNASDARGIDVVRNKIKGFAMNKVTLPPGRHKIIILDEADSMTSAAQQALRRTMEIYSKHTRFCLACNVSTKIIEAIQSRAAILRYSKLSNDQILDCLLRVCSAEQVNYTDDGLQALIFTSEGDMRHALNNLQAAVQLTRSESMVTTTTATATTKTVDGNDDDDANDQKKKKDSKIASGGFITQDIIYKVCDQPHPQVVNRAILACRQGDTLLAVKTLQSLVQLGYATSDIIGTLFRVVKAHLELPESLKLEYLREIGFTHLRILDGVNSPLQLYGLVSRLSSYPTTETAKKI